MASRRMFSKAVIDSDAFLDLPHSAQALYLHLSMGADDDGFLNNARKITRMAGCTDDDFQALAEHGFLIPFEKGVCAITHWKAQNYIPKDRYKPTEYKAEMALLAIGDHSEYYLTEEGRIQNVYKTDTNRSRSIGKDRLGKDRLDIYTSPKGDEPTALSIEYQKIVDLFNSVCVSLPKVKSLTDQRRKAIKTIHAFIDGSGGFQSFFERVEASDFLTGRSDNKWSACFDWIFKRANATKIIEGNYDNKDGAPGKKKEDFTDPSRYKDIHW